MWHRRRLPACTSLIITSYNQPKSLALVLEAVAGQIRPVDEIIIADDGSRQATFDVIGQCQARFNLPIKAVITQEDRGFRKSIVLNKAILESTGQQLLFLDGDVIAPPHWTIRHMQSYRPMGYTTGAYLRLNLDQSMDIISKGLQHVNWSEHLSRARYNLKIIRRYLKDKQGMLTGRYNKPRISGGNFSVDRGLLFGVNGFDERYVGFGGEDADLRNRMNNYGGRPTSLLYRTFGLHLHPGLETNEPKLPVPSNYQAKDLSVYASSKKNLWAVVGLTSRMDSDQSQDSCKNPKQKSLIFDGIRLAAARQ